MKEEKQILIDDLAEKFSGESFVLVADYGGLDVPGFATLRDKLSESGAECHVHKNTLVKRAAQAAEVPEEVSSFLAGPTALVTGGDDVSAAAKAIVETEKAVGRPQIRGGVVDGRIVDEAGLRALAKLPPLPVLQSKFLGLLKAPAGKLVRTLNEPASKFARLLKAKQEAG